MFAGNEEDLLHDEEHNGVGDGGDPIVDDSGAAGSGNSDDFEENFGDSGVDDGSNGTGTGGNDTVDEFGEEDFVF